jgi:hypothetical protein
VVVEVQYQADEIWILMFEVVFYIKINNVQIVNPNLDTLYVTRYYI